MSPYRDGVLEWHVELQSPDANTPEIAVRLYGEAEWWWLKLNLIPLLPSLDVLAAQELAVADRADLQTIIDALGAVRGLLDSIPPQSVIAAGYRVDPQTHERIEQRSLHVDHAKLEAITRAVREVCSCALATQRRVVFKSDRWG
jgi:hypothetical protein